MAKKDGEKYKSQRAYSGRIKKCLRGARYPSSKEGIVRYARDICGDEEVIAMLSGLPQQTFQGSKDITEILGGIWGKRIRLRWKDDNK